MNLPTITPPADATQPPVDYAAYPARQLAVQQFNVASYRPGDEQVWVKKPTRPMAWRATGCWVRWPRCLVCRC